MRLTDAWGDKFDAYETIEEALEAYRDEYLEEGEELEPDDEISLGVGRDLEGKYWFAIASEHHFTNCTIEFVTNKDPFFYSWDAWFKEEWIEKEIDHILCDKRDFEKEKIEQIEKAWDDVKGKGFIDLDGGEYLWTWSMLKRESWIEEALEYDEEELEDEDRKAEHDFAIENQDAPDDAIFYEEEGEYIVRVSSLDDLKLEMAGYYR